MLNSASMDWVPATKLTYHDYVMFPDDGLRHELIDGEHYVSPSPIPLHQRVLKRLGRRLEDYFELRRLGEVFYAPVDVILTNHDVVVPDLVVVARASQISDRAIEGAPLLVVEILSPSSVRRDRRLKFDRYAVLGVAHYWIVDPKARVIDCYRLQDTRYEQVVRVNGEEPLAHPDFPDLAIAAGGLWTTASRN